MLEILETLKRKRAALEEEPKNIKGRLYMKNRDVNKGITNANKNMYFVENVKVYDSDDSDKVGANDLKKLIDRGRQYMLICRCIDGR